MKNNPPPPFRYKISQKSILTFSITVRSWLNIFVSTLHAWLGKFKYIFTSVVQPTYFRDLHVLPFLHAFYHHIRTMLSHFAYLSDILVHCENQWSIQCICYWLWAMGPRLVWPLDYIRSLEALMLRLCNLFMSRAVLKYRFNVGLEWKKSWDHWFECVWYDSNVIVLGQQI